MKTYDFSICVSNNATGTEKWYNSDDFYSYDDMHDAIVDDIDELLQFINVKELVDYRYRYYITKTSNFVFWD